MRERVELFGGELHAGPRPGGGFVVRVHLPLDHPATAPTTATTAVRSPDAPAAAPAPVTPGAPAPQTPPQVPPLLPPPPTSGASRPRPF
ncbi:hypothetical protein B7486_72840 [cyanobacterium TDX16]|nr:hypothetical protein B7486_72840 [cyanobacterium TDX16]